MEQKSKSALALMEQAIMILVFAVAAAVCVSVFVKSRQMSQELADRDMAVNRCQTVAETVKATAGDIEETGKILGGKAEGNKMILSYGPDWEPCIEEKASYVVTLRCQETEGYLGRGTITVVTTAGEEVFSLPVNWQKEVAYE